MNRDIRTVPFGYVPTEETRKGTLIYYDSFESTTDEELNLAAELLERRSFKKLVLYPLHDETVKRMTRDPVSAYYKREDRLHEWKRESGFSHVTVENWEGKRKKYTPIDSALRHLTESYAAPHFLLVTPDTADLFASYTSFEQWIVKLRLLLTEEPRSVHPRLEQYRHRWDSVSAMMAKD